MLGLARQIDDLRLASFALRYILEAVDGPDNVSTAILDCLAIRGESALPDERTSSV
jgi:hypothetical protein